MGANDNCDYCGQPLDFFNYIIVVAKKMNGPEEERAMARRYCETCAKIKLNWVQLIL